MPLPIPQTLPEALDRSISSGAGNLLAPVFGALSYLPGRAGETMQEVESKAKRFTQANRDSLNQYPGNFLEQVAAELPGQWIGSIPEAVNLVGTGAVRAPAWVATKAPAVARAIEEFGPTAVNAAFAASRSYAADKDPNKALRAAMFNILGEKWVEPAFGSNLTGNVAGAMMENTYNNTPWDALKTAYGLYMGTDESQRSALNPRYKRLVEDALGARRDEAP
jgi:hypothetical protein